MNCKRNILILILIFVVTLSNRKVNADFVFGEPENLGSTINTSSNEGLASISSDGLSLYFTSNRPGGFGEVDLWQAKRATIEDEWAPAVNLGSTINTVARDFWPNVSADNLTLYFCSDRPNGQGNEDIWKITRPTVDDQWGPAENLGLFVNTPSNESGPCISADNLELYFTSDRSGNIDIYVSRRASTSDAWDEPVNLSTLNTTDGDAAPSLSADGLILFFESYRSGGFGGWDLYMATRKTKNSDWSSPINLGSPTNTSFNEIAPCISFDGRTLYFCYHPQTDPRPGGLGGNDIWQVTIDPVVDLNGDGIVDAADMCIIVDNWGTDDPLCDIGPTPFGDGIVDVQDLIVLTEHLFEEVI